MSIDTKKYDIAIIGGGILGTTLAFMLAREKGGEGIVVIEQESDVALHASGRNTGVIHRPFYLDPEKKKIFARCAQESYGFWKAYAAEKRLPWKEVGTIEVAMHAGGVERLRQYKQWSLANGMRDDEVRLLTLEEVKKIEPNVRCRGALLCTTDTAVDFGAFTRALRDDAIRNGVRFLFNTTVEKVSEESGRVAIVCNVEKNIGADFFVNCAGGGALNIAHMMGVGREYADINFRGEYRVVEGTSARLATHNIYSVPRHSEFSFLDPHFVVRHDGSVVIGPSAVPVGGPYTYRGIGNVFAKIFVQPFLPKVRLFTNPEFLALCMGEWRSALSHRAMAARVQQFLPALRLEDCRLRGRAGVRASLIDRNGRFVLEVVEVRTPRSLHLLNYNSPGATGASAYAKRLAQKLTI